MSSVDRFKLLGRYRTPRFQIGDVVDCMVRGPVTIVGITDGKIPWPIGKTYRARSLVVYKDLERAIGAEANLAVCHWWGITPQTVSKWRNALGMEGETKGTARLRSAHGARPELIQLRADGLRRTDLTERNQKIAEAKRGKARPAWLRKYLRKINLGKKASDETRARQSLANRSRATLNNGTRRWTAEEDRLVIEQSGEVAAERTGRTLKAVYSRRVRLGCADGRRRSELPADRITGNQDTQQSVPAGPGSSSRLHSNRQRDAVAPTRPLGASGK